ncbi:MAG TPA: hypothetical protein VJM32_01715 [Candidatus Saccharimonadales bacterium]|nr:hypothetical protein [Candidatus Saccharimonadales bacterium]
MKTQINQEMWADDTLTIHVDVTQLDATGTFRSVIGPNREKFAVLFAKYDPLRVREEDEYRPNSVYRVMLFLPAGIAPASAT